MNLHPCDDALQAVTPTVMVPRFGEFKPLDKPGHRFLAAADGLWLEAWRPGLYARQPLALQSKVAMPYGKLEACIDLGCGRIPKSALREFIALAVDALPNEAAMLLIWDQDAGRLQTSVPEIVSRSRGHVKYVRPELTPAQHVVADIHSHGGEDAFFSRTDNQDDVGDFKIAIVMGQVHQSNPQVKARLCMMGHYLELPIAL